MKLKTLIHNSILFALMFFLSSCSSGPSLDSIDFEKDLNVAKCLFQIYEYTRVALIEEFKSCKVNKSINALTALIEIRDSWKSISRI